MGMTENAHDALVTRIAQIIDHPSVYMGGPSRNSLRIAEAIVKEFSADLCASGQRVDLSDPVVVHANMLRGRIAKLTDEQIKHLHPDLCASGQQVRAEISNLSVWAGKAHPDQQLVDLAHVLAILDSNPAPQPEGRDDENVRWWNGEATHDEIRAEVERAEALTPAPDAAQTEAVGKTEKARRHAIGSHHEQMLDAQAQCVPCRLCGGKAVIDDAGSGYGYTIECENAARFSRPTCLQSGTRISGWAYNVSDMWNRLNAQPAAPAPGIAGDENIRWLNGEASASAIRTLANGESRD